MSRKGTFMSRTLNYLALSVIFLLSGCSLFKPKTVVLSPEKQIEMCRQIKWQMGDLQLSAMPNQGGNMPTTKAYLIDEYSRYNCVEVESKI
jgi:hypothetical protein